MGPLSQDVDTAPNPAVLSDKALNLRRRVNSAHVRISAQKETLERLRREFAELRALADQPRPATAYFKTGSGYAAWQPVPYIAIFFVAAGLPLHSPRPQPARAAAAPEPAAVSRPSPAPILDDGADEALMLARDWRLPGDERPLSERLGLAENPPGAQPEWTVGRTGERTYRVSFRPRRSEAGYDFDVDLGDRRVEPTPETAKLITG